MQRAKRTPVVLDREVIAVAVLAQFDSQPKGFSIRPLAESLGVSPSALYYYFPTRSLMIAAAVNLVWQEVFIDIMAAWAKLVLEEASIVEFMVTSAECTRRGFGRHFRIAPFIAADVSEPSELSSGSLAGLGAIVESLGVPSSQAGEVVFSYSTYVLGSIVFSAGRRLSREMDFNDGVTEVPRFSASGELRPVDAPQVAPETMHSLDRSIEVAPNSEEEDELFEAGLRYLIKGWLAT